jgi:anti-sigma factor RsiW
MKCNHIEELLPGYAGGDLDTDDAQRVEAHIEACATCRESLDIYLKLETQLVARSKLRPSAKAAARKAARAVGFGRRHWLDAFTGLPATAGGGLVVFGILWITFGDVIRDGFARLAAADLGARFLGVFDEWARGVDAVSGGSELTLPIVTAGLTALILLSGSWMVMRYVKN